MWHTMFAQKFQQIRYGLVPLDAQQIRGAADSERGQFGQRNVAPEFRTAKRSPARPAKNALPLVAL